MSQNVTCDRSYTSIIYIFKCGMYIVTCLINGAVLGVLKGQIVIVLFSAEKNNISYFCVRKDG